MLGWSEILYYVMAGPIAIAAASWAGSSTGRWTRASCADAIGGLVFGSFILIGHEIANNAPKAHLPDPQGGLVFVTTLGGAILGALGAYWRSRRPEPGRSPARAGSSASRR